MIAGISLQAANLYGYVLCKMGGESDISKITASFLSQTVFQTVSDRRWTPGLQEACGQLPLLMSPLSARLLSLGGVGCVSVSYRVLTPGLMLWVTRAFPRVTMPGRASCTGLGGGGALSVTLMPPLSEHGLPDSVTVCRQ